MTILKAFHPNDVGAITRRQLLKTGVSLAAYASIPKLLQPKVAMALPSFPIQRKLVWINMSGGWDLLEVTDPKQASTDGTTLLYDYSQSQEIIGGDGTRIGRFLPNLAQLGSDILIVRGLAMGTTSHSAGPVYMDTGILSNTGIVNSASIPAIVASQGASTIPLIQLAGGSTPQTDRGLAQTPVSVVRAENLALYRQMFPSTTQDTENRLKVLDYVDSALARLQSDMNTNFTTDDDRLAAFATASQKVRTQFENNVGAQMQLTQSELAQFTAQAPTGLNQNIAQTFGLALKLLKGGICDCINLGIGGFDTHTGQTARLQPILATTDFVVKRLTDGLAEAGLLDQTLIVLYSDFGRTPAVNSQNGRDHWPVGGALMLGGGIAGGRAVGETDTGLRALSIDFNTGRPDSSSNQLNPTHLGGSVLELTLGASYMTYRNYLTSIPALTRLKS